MDQWAWRNRWIVSGISWRARLVLHSLMSLPSWRQGTATPGIGWIASTSGISHRTAQRALGEAEAAGWIKSMKRSNQTTTYKQSAPSHSHPVTQSPRQPDTGGVTVWPLQGVTLTPNTRKEQGKNKEEEEAPPPVENLDPEGLIPKALAAYKKHVHHRHDDCPFAADRWARNNRWLSMFRAGLVSENVVVQAREALLKAEACRIGRTSNEDAAKAEVDRKRVQEEHDHLAQVIQEAEEDGKEPRTEHVEKLEQFRKRLETV